MSGENFNRHGGKETHRIGFEAVMADAKGQNHEGHPHTHTVAALVGVLVFRTALA
jgi:hypothetical protein